LNYLVGLTTVGNKLSSHFGAVKDKKNKKKQDDEGEDVRRKAIYVHRFFQEMGTQLFAPGVLVKKYASRSATPVRNEGEAAAFSPKAAVPSDYAATAAHYGQEAADYLRLGQVQIVDRDTAVMLQNIVDQMVKAVPGLAPALPGQVRVQVLASPDVQAFALPNGDIFVCNGLLDVLDNQGELAAVLAHELCHVASKDAAAKMHSEDRARDFMKKVQLGLAVAGGIVAPVMGMAAASAGSVSSLSSQLASSLTSSMVQQISPIAAAMMAEAALEGYSQEAELQADRFAVTTSACAGYDPQSMIGVLNKLQDVQEKTRAPGAAENRLVQSSLINAKPGLKERISQVEKVLSKKL
jgi:predicted Zn-dependent protease